MEHLVQGPVEVTIEGQRYSVRSDLNANQVKQLAGYVDQMMRDVKERSPTLNPSRVAILAALNIAEELFKVRENCADAAQRTSELIELIDRKCGPGDA